MSFPRLFGAVSIVLLLAAAGGAEEISKKEAAGRARAIAPLVDFAEWCAKSDARYEGETALEIARRIDPKDASIASAAEALKSAGKDGAKEGDVTRRRDSAHRAAAKALDQLWSLSRPEADDPRFEEYLFCAVDLERKGRVERLASHAERALKGSRPASAGRIIARAKGYFPRPTRADDEAEYEAKSPWAKLELELARKDAALIGQLAHPLVGWVSLPDDWKPGGTYPVLVAVEGAGCNFSGALRRFAKARGSRPWIVVVPITFSSTNALDRAKYPMYGEELLREWDGQRMAFDDPGLRTLLETIGRRFGGAKKAFITGFSGGGNLTYDMVLQHPGLVAAAVGACANYSGMGASGAQRPEDGGPPVALLTGELDPHRDAIHGREKPGLDEQTDAIERQLKELGFTRVTRETVKGAKHVAFVKEAVAFFEEAAGR